MVKDTMREAFEQTAMNTFNLILDHMDKNNLEVISRNEIIYVRDGFREKCDLT